MTGTTALRFIAAELLSVADSLGVTPKSLTVSLYSDQTPSEAQVWFYSYADAERFATYYGVADRVNLNGGSDSDLLYLGRAFYDTGAPTVAGTRVGLRLVCNRPAVTA